MRSLSILVALLAFNLSIGWAIASPDDPTWMMTLALVAIAVNAVAFVPAAITQSERYYDLVGSLTFLTLLAANATSWTGVRSAVLTAMVATWTIRLGSYLFQRIRSDGRDGRFDAIKTDPGRFAVAWMLQATWAFCTSCAALVLITTAPTQVGLTDLVGWALWCIGFGIEVTADRQKAAFRADPANKGRYITVGLWSWSRHPNYFGEILLWTGIWVSGIGVFSGGQWATVISPLLTYVLLTRVSGIPMLEKRADARWGDDPTYIAWRDRTPVLVPRPPEH